MDDKEDRNKRGMKLTQEQIVINQLKQYGYVTRNWALQNYISRLGAIVCDLNKTGWEITGDWIRTANGKDYKYTLIEAKKKKIYIYDLGADGVRRPREVMVPV